jgi:hypothetical protein
VTSRAGRLLSFCCIAAVYLALPNLYPRFQSPNELSRLRLTRALVEHRSFRIDPYLNNPSPQTVSDVAWYGGHFYSDKAAGMSLLAVPAVALVRAIRPEASMAALLVAARWSTVIIPALIALWFALSRCRTPFASMTVIGLFLGSVFYQGSLNFSGHVPAALAVAGAALLAGWGEATPRRIAGAGLLAGLAVLIDFTSAIAAGGLLAVIAVRTRSVRPVALFGFCCALIASIQLAVNAICFEGPFDFAYHHMYNPADQANRGSGFFGIALPQPNAIFGLTFGGMKGMFLHSPFLLLAWPALAAAFRRRTAIQVWAAAMCVVYFLMVASLRDWEGGWSLGPRYLTLIYPLTVFLMVEWFERDVIARWQLVAQIAIATTVTWSVLLHVTAMLTWPNPPVTDLLTFPALEVPAFLLFRGAFGPNLFAAAGLPPAIAAALVLVLALVPVVIHTGRRAVPYLPIVALLFAIALASAAPAAGTAIARRLEVFIYYIGANGAR